MINQHFLPVSLEHKHLYLQHWHAMPVHSMDYSFVNIWGWSNYYQLQLSFSDKLCWIAQKNDTLWAPVGAWQDVNWQNEQILDAGATIIRVPEQLANMIEQALPGRVERQETKGQWEYLYNTHDLATLSGNKYHKKRNHINGFKKAYGAPNYKNIDDATIEDVLSLQDKWCQWHECTNSKALFAENEAINSVLSHWYDFEHLIGGALYVDNTLVAFSVGELLDDTTLGVHYEKGHTSYRGVYQTMNSCFVQNAGANTSFINRAQDLDEEGLRHAKSSYLPVDFLKKYTLNIAPI